LPINSHLVRSSAAGALGGLLFGFDTAVIAGTTHALTAQFQLTPLQLGFTVSIALWGTVVGAVSAGDIGNRLGPRSTLRWLAVLYVVSAIGCALAWNWPSFLVARFIGGLAIGGSSVLGPVYVAELAPAAYRGRLVGLFQINIVVGILLAYFSNLMVNALHPGMTEWRWDFGVSALPAVLFFVMLLSIPHSPRWLVTKDRIQDAHSTIERLGHTDPDVELKDIIASYTRDGASHSESLFKRAYLYPMVLAITLAAFNQLSGINAVLYYLNDIFASAGFHGVSGGIQTVIVGAVNLVSTIIAMAVIDRLGRKTLLLAGCIGMTITLSGIAAIFISGRWRPALIFLLAAYIASFAISSGAVIWVYMSEIFPNAVRVKGQALGSTTLWVMNGVISQIFPWMAAKSASLPFIIFAVAMALQFVVTLAFFPETKGFSLEELQTRLGSKTSHGNAGAS
jgi:sugar porter (SP) family MFS transporter